MFFQKVKLFKRGGNVRFQRFVLKELMGSFICFPLLSDTPKTDCAIGKASMFLRSASHG